MTLSLYNYHRGGKWSNKTKMKWIFTTIGNNVSCVEISQIE